MGHVMMALAAPDLSPLPGSDIGTATRSIAAVFVVLALIAACAWLVRRGVLGPLGRKGPSAIRIDAALPLGERRSLMVVSVEGRRLLLGLTAQQVTLVTELGQAGAAAATADAAAASSFADSLERATGAPGGGGRS